jgi:prevent-host-death family protein
MATLPTQEIQPLTAFLDKPVELIRQIKATQRPITLTVDGKPEVVVQDAEEYERLLDLAAEADANEGIRQGLEELRRGEGRPASEFFAEMREKYGISG